MSEEALRRFLDRVNSEPGFREQAQRDPKAVLEAFDLSPVEQVAIGAGDEDALRRLAGMDVSGHAAPGSPQGAPGFGGSQFWCSWGCSLVQCDPRESKSEDPGDCRYVAPNA